MSLFGKSSTEDRNKSFFKSVGTKKEQKENIKSPSQPGPIKPLDEDTPSNPIVQDLLQIVELAYLLPELRKMRENLSLPRSERKQFKNLGRKDSQDMDKMLAGVESLFYELDMHQLPKNDPTSLGKFLNFKNRDLMFPIKKTNLEEVDERFIEEVMKMLHANAETLKTVEDVDNLFETLNGRQYFPKVDLAKEAKCNFPTQWINILHSYAAIIAQADIQKCLIMPAADESVENIDGYYERIINGDRIIHRSILSIDTKNKFLAEFQPVLEANIEYFHKFSKIRSINAYLGKALDIKYELYEMKEEEIAPEAGDQLEVKDKKNTIEQAVTPLATNEAGGSTDKTNIYSEKPKSREKISEEYDNNRISSLVNTVTTVLNEREAVSGIKEE